VFFVTAAANGKERLQMAFRSTRFTDDSVLEAAAKNDPPLCKGAKGPAVAAIQQALVDLGYPMPISMATPNATPDGIFGDETAATVKLFQGELKLAVDGIVGRDTLRALDEQSAFEDLRSVRNAVAEIDAAIAEIALTRDSGRLLAPGQVDMLWSRTATMKATLLIYEPGASLPASRVPRLWMANLPSGQGMGMSGAGVSANPLGAAIAVLLLAIFAVFRPTKMGPKYHHPKSSKSNHTVPLPPATILIPVVKAWEILIFAETVTKVTADALWRRIKYDDDYERMRRCKDLNPRVSPKCAEAWKEFEEIRNKLLQRLNQIKSGGQVIYPNLMAGADALYNGGMVAGRECIGYLKALAEVQKCFGCSTP
jgi:hypothetical protein